MTIDDYISDILMIKTTQPATTQALATYGPTHLAPLWPRCLRSGSCWLRHQGPWMTNQARNSVEMGNLWNKYIYIYVYCVTICIVYLYMYIYSYSQTFTIV